MFGLSPQMPSSPQWPEYHDRRRAEAILIVVLILLVFGGVIALMGWRWTWQHLVDSVQAFLHSFGWLSQIGPTLQGLKAHPLNGQTGIFILPSSHASPPLAVPMTAPHGTPVLSAQMGWWEMALMLVIVATVIGLSIVVRWPPRPAPFQPRHDEDAPSPWRHAYAGTLWGLSGAMGLCLLFHGFLWPRIWWTFPGVMWVRWGEALSVGMVGCLGAMAISRSYWRRWRQARTVWDELIFYQDDQISPVAYISVIDNIYEVIQTRSAVYNTHWWYRLWVGQNAWSINLLRAPDRDDPLRLHFVLAGPDPAIRRVEQAIATKYSNFRFRRTTPPPDHPWRFLIRWRLKYRSALHVIRLVSRDPIVPFDNVVQALSAANAATPAAAPPVFIQLLLTPITTHQARRSVQRAVNWAKWSQNAAEAEAAQQMLSQIGNGRWRTEWRAAADDYETLARITGAWAFESKYAEILPRNILAFRDYTRYCMQTHLPKLWPMRRGPVLWSSEIAAVFLFPTGETRVDDLSRSMMRRMPVPLATNRDPAMAIVEAETNAPDHPWVPVGLHNRDRHKNLLIRGIQGAGKSNTEINLFQADVLQQRDDGAWAKAVILIDIGKDTAAAALQMVPPDREVIWFSPHEEDNGWSLHSLASHPDDSAQVDQTLQMLIDVFGDDAIQARSKQILSQALRAVLEVRGERASLSDLHTMLTNEVGRNDMVNQVTNPDVKDYWTKEFEEGRKTNPGFWEEALAAPRNKLDALLRHERVKAAMDYYTAHQQMRQAIDWDTVIRDGKVVILNIDKAALGSDATRLFGIAALLNLWYAMQRQQWIREEDRRKVSVIIDEAQNFLSPTFTTIMAEGRAMGLEMTVAVRFLTEIPDPTIRDALINLCQNQIVYRINKPDEAQSLMYQAQRLYHNNITLQEDVMAITNFSADDFMHMDDHHAICLWQAQGKVQMPFNARTFDWRPRAHPEWAEWHRAHQPKATSPRSLSDEVREAAVRAEAQRAAEAMEPQTDAITWEMEAAFEAPSETVTTPDNASRTTGTDGTPPSETAETTRVRTDAPPPTRFSWQYQLSSGNAESGSVRSNRDDPIEGPGLDDLEAETMDLLTPAQDVAVSPTADPRYHWDTPEFLALLEEKHIPLLEIQNWKRDHQAPESWVIQQVIQILRTNPLGKPLFPKLVNSRLTQQWEQSAIRTQNTN